LPGSPTALPFLTPLAPRPPPPRPNVNGASTVRRLGVAMSPPGQAGELGGRPPVVAE
jgi:hypothetical protein